MGRKREKEANLFHLGHVVDESQMDLQNKADRVRTQITGRGLVQSLHRI